MGEFDERVQTSSYSMSRFWGLVNTMVSVVNCIALSTLNLL